MEVWGVIMFARFKNCKRNGENKVLQWKFLLRVFLPVIGVASEPIESDAHSNSPRF